MAYKILLVEDEVSLRTVYAEYLKMNGFNVVEAEDGEIAIQKVEENPDIDLILLDILLPKKDGLKVLEEIKNNNAHKHIKVYLATMLNNDKVIKEGFELGADGYIIKDTLNPDQLKQEILNAIEGKEEKPDQTPQPTNLN